MHASIVAIALVFLNGTTAGYAQVCLNKAEGCIDYQVTKDCCASLGGQQHFEESSHIYMSNNLCGGNGVNIGVMRTAARAGVLVVENFPTTDFAASPMFHRGVEHETMCPSPGLRRRAAVLNMDAASRWFGGGFWAGKCLQNHV